MQCFDVWKEVFKVEGAGGSMVVIVGEIEIGVSSRVASRLVVVGSRVKVFEVGALVYFRER